MSDPDGTTAATGRRARRGRQLDPSRDAAILAAALDGLAELGYDRLSMDEIAARAHAGKGALYRRWPSKARLIVDALLTWRNARGPVVVPDTGSLSGDIEAIIASVPDFDAPAERQLAVFLGLVTAASRDPELRVAITEDFLARPRRAIREVLDRAVAREEIGPEIDLELVSEILLGLNLLRIVNGELPDRNHVRRVMSGIIYPLVTRPLPPPGLSESSAS
jgi:AcrR family transcriptional regulator